MASIIICILYFINVRLVSISSGSVLVVHQGTPYPHRRCLSPVALYTNEHVPVSVLHNDVPCSHPYSSMLGQQSILPHHSQFTFYTPGDDAVTHFGFFSVIVVSLSYFYKCCKKHTLHSSDLNILQTPQSPFLEHD